ncbi:MAG: molybdate ABC transporter substrate-binding protein [Chloroflexota bacterium]
MLRNKFLSVLLLLVMSISAACAPQTAPTTESAAPASVPAAAVPAPTEVPPAAAPQPVTLTVLAAASLTESFTEIGKLFEAAHPGVTVTFSFAGSQMLAQQLDQGAPADVFASASKKYMDAAVTSNRVSKDTSQIFAKNRLIVIYPAANTAGIKELKDLAKPGIKLDFGDKTVPCGAYSLDFLDKASKDSSFDTGFKDAVLKNVVSYEDNVKSIITKVTMAEADAGIVYVTDVTAAVEPKTGTLAIPDALNTIASYPMAAISDSKNPDLAKAFIDFVLSTDGQAVLAKYKFLPIK